MANPDLSALTLKEASDRIGAKKVSPVELTEACLATIKTYNPKTDAWITVMREQALAQARLLEKEQAAGKFRSPLHGIPIGLKDNIDTAGTRTTAGSKTLAGNVPTEDADVTRRLLAAGAIVIGKCNMHIFASGATSAVSYFGPVRNPWNLALIAGGSSGGSAAAVAMDNCYAALGTDTGGSIRTPSAMCGVTGFKATYGRVSIRGIVPLTWSLDHCGPIARTVEDTAMVLQHIAGYDVLDLQSIDYPVPDYSKAIGAPVSQFRLGIPPMFYDGLDDEVSSAMDEAISLLNKMTKGSREIEMPSILGTGANSEGGVYRESLGSGFVGAETGGGGGGGGGARAVDYIREWRQLRLIRRTVDDDVFQKQNVDLLITPTIRHLPWTIEDELSRAAPSRRPVTPSPATPARSTTTVCRPLRSPAVSRKRAFRSACKSVARISPRSTSSLWRTPINKPPIGINAARHAGPGDTNVPPLSKPALGQPGDPVTR